MQKRPSDFDSLPRLIASFPEESQKFFHSGKLNFVVGLPWATLQRSPEPIVAVQLFTGTFSKKWLVCPPSSENDFLPPNWTRTTFKMVTFQPHFAFEHIFHAVHDSFYQKFHTPLEYLRFFNLEFVELADNYKFMLYTFVGLVREKNLPLSSTSPHFKLLSDKQAENLLHSLSNPLPSIESDIWSDLLTTGMIQGLIEESVRIQQIHSPTNPWSLGLFIGRFQPFHSGHLQVILDILHNVSFLKIGIGSCQYHHEKTNPFTWKERRNMISLALQEAHIPSDRYEISPLQDDHNIYKWLDRVLHQFGEFQVYFANNAWTRQLMLQAGKEACPLQKYSFTSWNGSSIRETLRIDQSVSDFVPPAVLRYLDTIDARKRIRTVS